MAGRTTVVLEYHAAAKCPVILKLQEPERFPFLREHQLTLPAASTIPERAPSLGEHHPAARTPSQVILKLGLPIPCPSGDQRLVAAPGEGRR